MSSTQQPHFDSVPKKWEDWAKVARKFGVFRATVHNRQEFRSASKITQDEYLLLKVLWPKRLQSSKCKDKLNLGAVYDQAWDWLNTFQPLQVYLDSISHATAPGVSDLGAFEVAFAQQCEARDLMRNANPLGLKSPNEDIVNASLISLLTAIFVKHPTVNATWTPQRAGLAASFRNGKIECQVDGFLALNANSSTRMVVEVKSRSRQLCEPQISMQEAAELVAAVTTGPPNGLRRDRAFLLSQDGEELYLAQATFGDAYADFMADRRRAIKKTDFPKVQQYGPWMIHQKEDIMHFAAVILAIAQI